MTLAAFIRECLGADPPIQDAAAHFAIEDGSAILILNPANVIDAPIRFQVPEHVVLADLDTQTKD